MYSGALSTVPPTTATWDFLFNWYIISGVPAAIVVLSLLVYVAYHYRAKEGKATVQQYKPTSWKVALAVALLMGVILAGAGYQTFSAATNIEIPKTANSVTVDVQGFQWGWNFTYPNGQFAVGNLTVPVDKVVILNITSKDVFHSFGITMLSVKEDAIPGKVNQLWFNMTQTGVYKDAIRCFELCGVGHAFMIANLTVVSQSAWNAWMK